MEKGVALLLCITFLILLVTAGCSSSGHIDTVIEEPDISELPEYNLRNNENESSSSAEASEFDGKTAETAANERKDIIQLPDSIVWSQNGVQTTFLPDTSEYLEIYELMLDRIPDDLDELQDLLSESDMSILLSCSSTVIFNYEEMVEIEYINESTQSQYSYDKLYFPLEIYDNNSFSNLYSGVMILSPRLSGSEGPLQSPDPVIEYLNSLQIDLYTDAASLPEYEE